MTVEETPPSNPAPVDPPKVEPPAPTPAPVDPPKEPESKVFTQDEVTRKMATEKKQGRQAALDELAQKLGKPLEEVEAIVADHSKREEDQKSELQKLADENARLKTEKDSQVAEAQKELHINRIKTRLLRPGLLPKETAESDEALDRVVGLIKAQTGASAEDIDTDIESLTAQFPQLFAQADPETPKVPTPSGVPSGTPRKTTVGETREDRAKRLAEQSNQSRGIKVTTS